MKTITQLFFLPLALILTGCGGGETSSAPGGGSCDNATVQGKYVGGMKLLMNNTGDFTGIGWSAIVEGDNVTFDSISLARTVTGVGTFGVISNPLTGTLQSCRFDAGYACDGGDRVNMKLFFNPDGTVTGELNGQCGTSNLSGIDRGWTGGFSGSRS